jgi:hypothetical protein
MEDADGIAQWNASGSRRNSIVTAGSRTEQLEGIQFDWKRSVRVPEWERRKQHWNPAPFGIYHSSMLLLIEIPDA